MATTANKTKKSSPYNPTNKVKDVKGILDGLDSHAYVLGVDPSYGKKGTAFVAVRVDRGGATPKPVCVARGGLNQTKKISVHTKGADSIVANSVPAVIRDLIGAAIAERAPIIVGIESSNVYVDGRQVNYFKGYTSRDKTNQPMYALTRGLLKYFNGLAHTVHTMYIYTSSRCSRLRIPCSKDHDLNKECNLEFMNKYIGSDPGCIFPKDNVMTRDIGTDTDACDAALNVVYILLVAGAIVIAVGSAAGDAAEVGCSRGPTTTAAANCIDLTGDDDDVPDVVVGGRNATKAKALPVVVDLT